MGNVNMDATQIHYDDKNAPTVKRALDFLKQLSGNLSALVSELSEDVQGKSDKTDIAPIFDDTAAYMPDDLVYYENGLYIFTTDHDPGEWNAEEVIAVNLNTVLGDIRSQPSGLQVKTKSYTGTGTNPNVIDFGQETPALILGIFADPAETFTTDNYEMVGPFGWGDMLAMSYWSTQSGGVPTTNNGGTNLARITYTGNSISIAANNASAVGNYNGQKYVCKYLA